MHCHPTHTSVHVWPHPHQHTCVGTPTSVAPPTPAYMCGRLPDVLLGTNSQELINNGVQTVGEQDSLFAHHTHWNKVTRTNLEEKLQPRLPRLWEVKGHTSEQIKLAENYPSSQFPAPDLCQRISEGLAGRCTVLFGNVAHHLYLANTNRC